MAYLVTGGTGFIGSYVVRDLLNRGEKVVCLQRSGMTPVFREVVGEDNISKIKVVTGDVSNSLHLFNIIREHDIELIIHLAYVLRPVTDLQPTYALQVNCIGTNNVLDAVRLFHLRRAVLVSSTVVLGRLGERYKEPVKDDSEYYDLPSVYAVTKVVNEVMGRQYFKEFGVDNIVLRLGRVFGIGKWTGGGALESELFRKAALNIPVVVQNADVVWGYSYVENVSELIVRACAAAVTKTRVFNAIDTHSSMRQIAEIARKVNPEAQITIEGGTGGLYWPPRLDTTGVRVELGWQPKYSLEEGIRKNMNYSRRQEGLPLF